MRYTEFNPSISEAPMNPGEYHKAIDTGHTKGVLVGFEFECVVPKLTIRGAPEPEQEKHGRTKEEVSNIIGENNFLFDLYISDLKPKEFDKIFKFLPGKSQYPDMVTAHKAFEQSLIDKVKELFTEVPEKIRIKEIPVARLNSTSGPGRWQPSKNKQLNFAYQFGKILTDYHTRRAGGVVEVRHLGMKIKKIAGQHDYDDLLVFTFPDQDYKHITNFLDFDPEVVYQKLSLSDYEEYDDEMYLDNDSEDDDYAGATKVLKPALEQTMGRTVTIFKRYHERPKNMTDWYIEPDGSLNADNDGDGTAEVVSPPLPAKDAVTALKNFFAMAAKMGIYTNYSTGLHINVSIPDTLDILKLAVFTGDQYVLKNFNRLNSDYAQSVTRDIPKSVDGDAITIKQGPKKDKNVFGQRKQTTEINTKMIQKIAREISDDHVASISYNGKWVSFRHTGGNYLKDYTEIYNVVGRFVRAIIIASDPTLYDREYKVAVAKLATPADNPDGTLASRLNYISSNGVPVLEISMASAGRAATVDPKKIFKQVCNDSYALPSYVNMAPSQITLTPNSTTARQKMKSKASSTGRFAAWEQTAMSDRFVTAIYCPLSQVEINRINDRSESGGIQITGTTYYQITKSLIPGSDPRAKQIMLNMRKEHYRDKLGRQAPVRFR